MQVSYIQYFPFYNIYFVQAHVAELQEHISLLEEELRKSDEVIAQSQNGSCKWLTIFILLNSLLLEVSAAQEAVGTIEAQLEAEKEELARVKYYSSEKEAGEEY